MRDTAPPLMAEQLAKEVEVMERVHVELMNALRADPLSSGTVMLEKEQE